MKCNECKKLGNSYRMGMSKDNKCFKVCIRCGEPIGQTSHQGFCCKNTINQAFICGKKTMFEGD